MKGPRVATNGEVHREAREGLIPAADLQNARASVRSDGELEVFEEIRQLRPADPVVTLWTKDLFAAASPLDRLPEALTRLAFRRDLRGAAVEVFERDAEDLRANER